MKLRLSDATPLELARIAIAVRQGFCSCPFCDAHLGGGALHTTSCELRQVEQTAMDECIEPCKDATV